VTNLTICHAMLANTAGWMNDLSGCLIVQAGADRFENY